MRKFTHLEALDRPRRRKSNAPMILLVVLILIATPFLCEVAKMNLTQFRLFGFSGRADTPLLDFVSTQWEFSHGQIRDWSAPYLVNRRWTPQMVIPFAFFWTAMAALMLRRGH
jgi:hypothetical protein